MRSHTNNLPVYSEYKNNRRVEQTTIIRHIRGDIDVNFYVLLKIFLFRFSQKN